MLKTVTITGADNSIRLDELFKLSDKFPFVEWGILVSRSSQGTPRFPSFLWMLELSDMNEARALDGKEPIKLSCHLCGAYVRELLGGDDKFIKTELETIWDMFNRVQINTHGEPHNTGFLFSDGLNLNDGDKKEWIFQFDNVNSEIMEEAIHDGVNAAALFDLSHGAGVLPEDWPKPIHNIHCGYAGGLSPENLKNQIKIIEGVVGKTPIWIDMETHVRSNGDLQFDLEKVEKCLLIAEPWVLL